MAGKVKRWKVGDQTAGSGKGKGATPMSSHKDPKPNQTVAAGNPLGDPPAPLGQPAGGEAKARTDEEHRSEPPPGVAQAATQGHSSRSGSSEARNALASIVRGW